MLGFDALGRLAPGEIPGAAAPAVTQTATSTQWAAPRKTALTVAVIATTFVGFVPPPPAQASRQFTKFSDPVRKSSLALSVWPNTPALAVLSRPVFTQFSVPQKVNTSAGSFTNAPQPGRVQFYVFGQFSQPANSRGLIADEMPSALFEVAPPPVVAINFTAFSQPQPSRGNQQQISTLFEILPPPGPPFTGFARFEGPLRAKISIALFSEFRSVPVLVPPVDTHDGVWVKRKRKKLYPDPIDIELEEKAKRRAALELAVYGPEVEYQESLPAFAPIPRAPVDVTELAQVIAMAQAVQAGERRSRDEQDEETELETILQAIL